MIPLVYKGILLKNAMGFNRTFMELKHADYLAANAKRKSFNRTFMELKQGLGYDNTAKAVIVLIGPSWN